jgi:predicted nuclease of predicted toxin-antitoxin system
VKLLLDMGLARRAAEHLRAVGFDAVHLSERGLQRLPDEAILALAREEERVVVTLDADFSALLAVAGALTPSVIHLRMEGLSHWAAAEWVSAVVDAFEPDLLAGCIASVTSRGTRVRALPIAGRV